MKILVLSIFTLILISSCQSKENKDKLKKEVFNTEKDFEKMAEEKGIEEAFYFYADEDAVILRENDTLIYGRSNIKSYYSKDNYKNMTVHWTPSFIDVSDCGSLAYTYGKYILTFKENDSVGNEIKGVFHTVWKRQKDNSWKYVWD